MRTVLARKLGMSRIFTKEGKVIPITLLEAELSKVVRLRTKEKDGYEALQVGFGKNARKLKELPFTDFLKVGDEIPLDGFQEGEKVKVSGISKGKGFQGGVKRHGFHGRNSTRGTKHEERTIGSVGAARPSRVWKGKRLPGRMGAGRITVKNLEIIKVDLEQKLLVLKGAVPGRRGTLLTVKAAKA